MEKPTTECAFGRFPVDPYMVSHPPAGLISEFYLVRYLILPNALASPLNEPSESMKAATRGAEHSNAAGQSTNYGTPVHTIPVMR